MIRLLIHCHSLVSAEEARAIRKELRAFARSIGKRAAAAGWQAQLRDIKAAVRLIVTPQLCNDVYLLTQCRRTHRFSRPERPVTLP
jgi:hypothetical protein